MDELSQWLRAAAAGDRAALAAVVEGTQADVWRFCAHLVDVDAADDLTQDVYLRALGSVHRFRGDASARTWLLAIARNAAADHIRGQQRRRRLHPVHLDDPVVRSDGPAGGSSARAHAFRAAAAQDPAVSLALTDLLDVLDVGRREAFVLTQVLGLRYQEAADACGVPVGTIRSRVARAREQLVEALRDAERAGAPERVQRGA